MVTNMLGRTAKGTVDFGTDSDGKIHRELVSGEIVAVAQVNHTLFLWILHEGRCFSLNSNSSNTVVLHRDYVEALR